MMVIRRRRTRRLFVTGGSGFLGQHIVNAPDAERWEMVAPGSSGLDIRNPHSMRHAIRDWKPTAIIHTAYRMGDPATIIDATRHIAEVAAATKTRLIHVSTDAVFPGRLAPYREADLPNPVHDYGRHKAAAERIVAATYPAAVTARLSLLYGRDKPSNHERLVIDAVRHGTTTRFFTDEVRTPALVDDVAAALIGLAGRTDIVGMLHLGGPEALSRAQLAVMTAKKFGLNPDRLQFGTIADSGLARPTHVVLDSSLARDHGIAVRGPTH